MMRYYREVVHALRTRIYPEAAARFADAPRREAWIFREILARLPLARYDGSTPLGGDYGVDDRADIPVEGPGLPAVFPVLPEVWTQLSALSCRVGFSAAHTTLDYGHILRTGLRAICDTLPANTYGVAEKMALEGMIAFGRRVAAAGFPACRQVPELPARNFAEALQSLWLLHTAIGIAERSYDSLSLGRMDQYLYEYYVRDRAAGMSEAEAAAWLDAFFDKLNCYGDAACALNVGGQLPDGSDAFQELSRLIVEVAAKRRQPAPLLAVRWHEGMADTDLERVLRPELFTIGQPTLYCEANCRALLARRGVKPADIDAWAVNSCMGIMAAGMEFADMWAVVFNCLLPLELAVNRGRLFGGDFPLPLRTRPAESFADFEALLAKYAEYTRELLAILLDLHGEITRLQAEQAPDPYLSALLQGAPGRDRLDGGVRYHTGNVVCFGLVNAADALLAIEELVFLRQAHPLSELIAAAQADYRDSEVLRRKILAVPKYGNGDDRADRCAARVAAVTAAAVNAAGSGRSIRYLPSFHTLNVHVGAGAALGASLDGRRAGEPLAKNVGPAQGRNRNGISGMMLSATRVGQQAFPGGQALDIHLDRSLYATREARHNLAEAVKTYFRLGGLQLQINAVAVEELETAMREPEAYGHLQVRIGGFSMYYTGLPREIQREMIERFRSYGWC